MGAAVNTKPPGAPVVISRPARGVLARTAFCIPCGARGARRGLVDDFRPASAAKPSRAPFGVDLPFRRPAFLAAGFADGAPFDGRLPSAQRTEARLAPFAPALFVPLARHAAAALGIAPAISRSLKPGPLVSGAFRCPASSEAGLAETSPGRRAVLPAFNAQTHGAAFLYPPPVAFALVLAPGFRVPVGHPVSLPGVDGIRAAGAWPARRLAAGLTGTASCPTRGVLPTAAARCRGP